MNRALKSIGCFFRTQLLNGFAPTGLATVARIRHDQRGVALVTALCMTMISLTIVMSLMYMITQGIKTSGANKQYHSVLQATYGGFDLLTKDVLIKAFANSSSASSVPGSYPGLNMAVSDCFAKKISNPTVAWPANCSQTDSAKQNPDISFVLQSNTATPYTIYAKVVDTAGAGNTGTGVGGGSGVGGNTETAIITSLRMAHNVTEGGEGGGGTTIPRLFRIEVQGERSNNPVETSKLSVLYAY